MKRKEIINFLDSFNLKENIICEILLPKKKSYCIIEVSSSAKQFAAELVSKTQSVEHFILDQKNREVKVIGFFIEEVPNEDLPVPCAPPRGLVQMKNFITEEEEVNLKRFLIDSFESRNISLKKRSVMHFGRHFDYATNR